MMKYWLLFLLLGWGAALGNLESHLSVHEEEFLNNITKKKELENYESCFRRALEKFDRLPECDELPEHTRRSLCVFTSICHLQTSGRPFSDCQGYFDSSEALLSCTRNMSNEQFAVYSEHLLHLDSLCYYLKSKLWNEKKQELIEKLATHSAEVLSAILFVTDNTRAIAELQQASAASIGMLRNEIVTVSNVTESILQNARSLQDTQLVMQNFFDGNLAYLLFLMETILRYVKAMTDLQRLLSTSLDWYLCISKLLPGALVALILSCGGLFKPKQACLTLLIFATLLSLYIFASYRSSELDPSAKIFEGSTDTNILYQHTSYPQKNYESRYSSIENPHDELLPHLVSEEHLRKDSRVPKILTKSRTMSYPLVYVSQVGKLGVVYSLGIVRLFGSSVNKLGQMILDSIYGEYASPTCEANNEGVSYCASKQEFHMDCRDMPRPDKRSSYLGDPALHSNASEALNDNSTRLGGYVSTCGMFLSHVKRRLSDCATKLRSAAQSFANVTAQVQQYMHVVSPEVDAIQFQEGIRHIICAYYATLLILLLYKPVIIALSIVRGICKILYFVSHYSIGFAMYAITVYFPGSGMSSFPNPDEKMPALVDARPLSNEHIAHHFHNLHGLTTPDVPEWVHEKQLTEERFSNLRGMTGSAGSHKGLGTNSFGRAYSGLQEHPIGQERTHTQSMKKRLELSPNGSSTGFGAFASQLGDFSNGYPSWLCKKPDNDRSELGDLYAQHESTPLASADRYDASSPIIMKEILEVEDPIAQEESVLAKEETDAVPELPALRRRNARKRIREDEDNVTIVTSAKKTKRTATSLKSNAESVHTQDSPSTSTTGKKRKRERESRPEKPPTSKRKQAVPKGSK